MTHGEARFHSPTATPPPQSERYPADLMGGATLASPLLAVGVDTAEWHLRVPPAGLGMLRAQLEAGELPLGTWECRRGRRGYRYLLHGDDGLEVSLAPAAHPEMGVHVRAGPRWLRPRAPEQWEPELRHLLAGWGTPVQWLRLNRADIAVDLLWESELLEKLDARQLVSRAQKRDFHCEGTRPTGISVGKAPLRFRLYDKAHQPGVDLDFWLPLWGLDSVPAGTVWRCEWELRREVLEEFSVAGVADLLAVQGDVLRYLTERWVRLAEPAVGKDHRRADLPLWRQLRESLTACPLGVQGVLRRGRPQRPPALRARDAAIVGILGFQVALGVERGLTHPVSLAVALSELQHELVLPQACERLAVRWQRAHRRWSA